MTGRRKSILCFLGAGLVLAGAIAFALVSKGVQHVRCYPDIATCFTGRFPEHPALRPFIVPALVVGALCALALVVLGVRKPRTA